MKIVIMMTKIMKWATECAWNSDGSSSSSPSPTEGSSVDEEAPRLHFDTSLSVLHNYLGNGLDELRGRTMFDEGSEVSLPILTLNGIILMPGQTLPIMITYPPTVELVRSVIATNGMFGVTSVRYHEMDEPGLEKIGTIAEVYEFQDEPDGFRIKARGQQRLQILEAVHRDDGNMQAVVRVLHEVRLPSSLHGARFESLDKYRCSSHASANKQLVQRREAFFKRDSIVTQWPHWVHKLYCTESLCKRVKSNLDFIKLGKTSEIPALPDDPSDLSYWVAQAMPINNEQRLTLLHISSSIQRLQWELNILEKHQMLCCTDCNSFVANPKDAFSMSVEGPHGTYVNSNGFIHEILTLHKASGLHLLSDEPSTEYSWFPGYAWTIAECQFCKRHMGWKFTATGRLRPAKFWAVCRTAVVAKIINQDEIDPIS